MNKNAIFLLIIIISVLFYNTPAFAFGDTNWKLTKKDIINKSMECNKKTGILPPQAYAKQIESWKGSILH